MSKQPKGSTAESFSRPFLVGTEYYRAPMPPQKFWDEDFAAIRSAGMHIIRTFSFWNWMEPQQGCYQFDDFDRFFELAQKHGLMVWFDMTLATHGACPEWLTRECPDIRVVTADGLPAHPSAGSAAPQGTQIHCYDHPKWKEHGKELLRAFVSRYKNAPNLLLWSVWDGVCLPSAWARSPYSEYPCYCRSTIDKYLAWLKSKYSLDELNKRFFRRYRRWEEVSPPRSNENGVEMLLYRQFHYENLAQTLKWQVKIVKSLDGKHEVRAHGGWSPRPWDEICSKEVDSWGMSMPSNNLLTGDDPYKISDRYFSFDWSRSIGQNGRWWHEEIYAGMSPGGVIWRKQSEPAELTTLMWMTLAAGGAGCLFWQYTPEYLSFEAPGYSLTAPDRSPTPRLNAVSRTISAMESISKYLPLEVTPAEIAVVYSPKSNEIFNYRDAGELFLKDLRGVYRTLWENNIRMDITTPSKDWSSYKVVYLPNVALFDPETVQQIKQTLKKTKTHLVADGNFGNYTESGHFSYSPPEGISELIEAGVADFSMLTQKEIAEGKNILSTPYGEIPITSFCPFATLKFKGNTRPIVKLGEQTVGVETAGRRLTWFGFSLSAAFGDAGSPNLVLPLFRSFGITSPFQLTGDRVIVMRRRSKLGGWLIFIFNLEAKKANTAIKLNWAVKEATDLLEKKKLPVSNNNLSLSVNPGGMKLILTNG